MNELMAQLFGDKEYLFELVGSTALLGRGEDLDIAVRVPEELADEEIHALQQLGWTSQGAAYRQIVNGNNFASLKKENVNLLLCFDTASWDRFVKGRDMCLFLQSLGVNMESKKVRIAIHALSAGESLEGVKSDVERLRV